VLAQPRQAVDERARLCGVTAATSLALVGWPQYLALLLDSDAATSDLFRALRNVAVAGRDGKAGGAIDVAVLASAERSVLHDDLDRVLKRSSASAGKRKLTVWKSGKPDEPWVVAGAAPLGQKVLYGLIWGGHATLDWLWGQPTPSATPGPAAAVAMVRVRLAWLARHVLEPVLGVTGLAALAGANGTAWARLGLEPQLLHLELHVRPAP
jgi:hypothetical protein